MIGTSVLSGNDIRLNTEMNDCVEALARTGFTLAFYAMERGIPEWDYEGNIVDTACVMYDTDLMDYRYIWNVGFWKKLNVFARRFAVAHEMLHIVLEHPLRIGDRDPAIFNIAADISVNFMLDKAGLPYFYAPNGVINHESAEFVNLGINPEIQSVEDIYELLCKSNRENLTKKFDITRVGHHEWKDAESRSFKIQSTKSRAMHGDINYDQISKKLPTSKSDYDVFRALKALAKDKNIPWDKYLSGFLGSMFEPVSNLTWAKIDRRIGSLYPDTHLPMMEEEDLPTKKRVLFAIDSSGSMNSDILDRAVSIYEALPENCEKVAISWDTDWYEIPSIQDRKVRGGGGTRVRSVLDYLTSRGGESKFDVVVVFTDGYWYDSLQSVCKQPSNWVFIFTDPYRPTKSIPSGSHSIQVSEGWWYSQMTRNS